MGMAVCNHRVRQTRKFRYEGKTYSVCECWLAWKAKDSEAALKSLLFHAKSVEVS